tara:strand:- start:457 stop:624 length:168 start_codon:yes stop_codon:yes gene_type:complete
LKILKKTGSLGTKGAQIKLFPTFSGIIKKYVQISNLFGLFSGKLKPTYGKTVSAG